MTEREQIEQRIAENERRITEGEHKQAELQRNMIEQERNMAKQIKEILDKGIPKADIAKATDFSIEYIDGLLEKFYPQVPAKEQNSDIQSQLNFLKQQVQILQKKLVNQEFENVQLKQQLNTIQAKGANMADNNEPIQTQEAIQQWEYKSYPLPAGVQNQAKQEEDLNNLGKEGWEMVAATTGKLHFKRPKKKEPDYGYGR